MSNQKIWLLAQKIAMSNHYMVRTNFWVQIRVKAVVLSLFHGQLQYILHT